MFPFVPKRSLFDNPEENIGLSPEDFFGLRMAKFDPIAMAQMNMPTSDYDVKARLAELYTPESEVSALYKEALKNIPQREKPGKLRKFAAIMAGLSGDPKKADYVLNKPYYQKLEDWKLKAEELGKGASQERLSNVNERSLATQIIGQELQDKSIAARTQNQLNRLELDKQKSDQQYEIKVRDLERKASEAEAKLVQRQAEMQQKGDNFQTTMAYRDAQLAAMNARHALDIAQKEKALDESKRLHDIMAEKWKKEDEDRNTRLSQYEKQLGINQQKADKTAPTGDKTTVVETIDNKGNVKETKRTTTTTGGSGKQPNDAIRTRAIEILKTQGKPVTEKNIQFVMDKLGKQ